MKYLHLYTSLATAINNLSETPTIAVLKGINKALIVKGYNTIIFKKGDDNFITYEEDDIN